MAPLPLPHGGAVAQLGERLVRNEEVRGSNPLGSTNLRANAALVGKPDESGKWPAAMTGFLFRG